MTDSDNSNVNSPARAILPNQRAINALSGVGSPQTQGFFGQSQHAVQPQFLNQKLGQQNMGHQNMGQQNMGQQRNNMMMNNGNNPQPYANPVGQQIEVTSTTTTSKKVFNSNSQAPQRQ